MNKTETPLTFDEFRKRVAQELQVDESQINADTSFNQDLFTDSIRLVELLLKFNEEGIEIPFEEAWNVDTVGDAYKLYAAHVPGKDGGS